MKLSRKILSLVLALVMVMGLATVALADGEEKTYSITTPDNGHTYNVYQIFTGDLSGTTLSNVKWGQNGKNNGTAVTVGDAVPDTILTELTDLTGSDTEKLAVIKKYVNLEDTAFKMIAPNTTEEVPAGYYLIKDKDAVTGNDAQTLYLVKIVGNVTIVPKDNGTPTFEKKIKDVNDSTGETSNWQDSADYDIGDEVPFQLKATLPDSVSVYSTYKVIFHDTLSAGLTFKDGSVVVKIGNTDVTASFTVTPDSTKNTLTISCDDVKAIGATNDSVITVEYKATLNDKAVIGSDGNPNTANLEFSNNPNGEGTGTTPDDKVIVFTYKTIINKVDSAQKPLTGAEFKLEKQIKGNPDTWKTISVVKNTEGTVFTFSGLDDGNYRLTETKTPAGYNSIDPIYFTITAEHDVLSDNPILTSLNGKEKNEDFTTDKEQGLAFTPDTSDSSLSADIVNKAGTELPSTGGMGTTIFYVLGSILVIGAVVLLITKKRMSAAD